MSRLHKAAFPAAYLIVALALGLYLLLPGRPPPPADSPFSPACLTHEGAGVFNLAINDITMISGEGKCGIEGHDALVLFERLANSADDQEKKSVYLQRAEALRAMNRKARIRGTFLYFASLILGYIFLRSLFSRMQKRTAVPPPAPEHGGTASADGDPASGCDSLKECPQCSMFNPPSASSCLCGHKFDLPGYSP